MSLKQRLLLLVLSTVCLVWLAAAVFTYWDAKQELEQVLDAHLAQASTLLVAQSTEELDDLEEEKAPLLHKYSRRVAFQIWEASDKLLFHSGNSPTTPLAGSKTGFSDIRIAGQDWRVFTSQAQGEHDHQLIIHVAERKDVREQLANSIIANLLTPLWFTLPLLAILLWWAVATSLKPLVKLTQAVAQRKPDNLSAIALQTPVEVQPLVERLNQLFSRTKALIENERRFTADAAHELRTPIAGIQAQVQVAQAALSAENREHALTQALQGCQRASHLIAQLLTLARLESNASTSFLSCDLQELAKQQISELAPSALEQGVQLELAEGEPVHIQGLATLLEVLLRNLLDNAIRYTGANTEVVVTASSIDQQACLTICDTGPGLAPEEIAKITERFYRPADTTGTGSGLGLSIVKRIVELHAGSLQIKQGATGRGLCVSIYFPTRT
ncbi:ATP-binding protein [uncultured Thiothrix sp.]|uniref:ATP-binding protein n=1 Tax=uncultured Thiothrix sp. TaxID=223185 RepID=UPI002611A531|nr:ATP-binding protein [uncultured Thiothrix sp.]